MYEIRAFNPAVRVVTFVTILPFKGGAGITHSTTRNKNKLLTQWFGFEQGGLLDIGTINLFIYTWNQYRYEVVFY